MEKTTIITIIAILIIIVIIIIVIVTIVTDPLTHSPAPPNSLPPPSSSAHLYASSAAGHPAMKAVGT